jgi:hypothetical protein
VTTSFQVNLQALILKTRPGFACYSSAGLYKCILEAELMIDSCLWTCFIWYLFATAGYHLDTLLDTLEEGRHSFLDFSTFPDLLKSSNPSLSASYALHSQGFFVERGLFTLRISLKGLGTACRRKFLSLRR